MKCCRMSLAAFLAFPLLRTALGKMIEPVTAEAHPVFLQECTTVIDALGHEGFILIKIMQFPAHRAGSVTAGGRVFTCGEATAALLALCFPFVGRCTLVLESRDI